MSDTVLYNAGHIEGALAGIQSLNAQGQDQAHNMSQQYRMLDEVSAGQGTSAGLEFGASSDQIRAETAEITQMIHQAVHTSHEDQIGVDSWARGIMGA